MRVVVDTCVLLDGALDPQSNAAQLPSLRDHGVEFLVCRWALDEARAVVRRDARGRHELCESLMVVIEEFASRLSRLVIDDGGTHLPRSKDAHAKRSIEVTGADRIVTRNLKDFTGYPAVTPIELRRVHDFHSTSIESPWREPRIEGTVAVGCRCFPGESFGWLLAGEHDERVGLSADGRGRISGLNPTRSQQHDLVPHGPALTIFARFKAGSEIEIGFIDRDAEPSKVHIAASYRLPQQVRFVPFLKYLPGNEWNMECWWMGCIGRWLTNSQMVRVAQHQTTEAVVSGLSVRTVLDKMLLFRHEVTHDGELVEMALPGAERTAYFRPEWT